MQLQSQPTEVNEGLRDADLTVLFWSPEAARSDWTISSNGLR